VASVSAAKEVILPEKISTLFHLIEKQEKITKALIEFCKSTRVEDLEILTSIKGISDKTGATFLAEIGRFHDFPSPKKIIAFAGIDPTLHQSGKFEGMSKISKRGNRHLRRVIFLMAKHVSREDTFFKQYCLRRRMEGLSFKEVLLQPINLSGLFSLCCRTEPISAPNRIKKLTVVDYKSFLGVIFRSRGLRVESEYNEKNNPRRFTI
jgi:hypothetical protein